MRRSTIAVLTVTILLAGACTSGDPADENPTAADGRAGAAAVVEDRPAEDDGPRCDAPRPAVPGTTEAVFTGGPTERTYRLTIPEGYDGSTPVPVILLLHGATSTGADIDEASRMSEVAGSRGYVVVAPDALDSSVVIGSGDTMAGGLWNLVPGFIPPGDDEVVDGATDVDAELSEDDDAAFIDALLDELLDELCIDADRQYAAGHSAGAGMLTYMACRPDQRFAAVAPVAGVNMTLFCPGDDVPPLVTFHGDADTAMPYEGGAILGIELGSPTVEDRLDEIATTTACSWDGEAPPSNDDTIDGVVHMRWNCTQDHRIEAYRITGWGHGWPDAVGAGIDATEVMVDFFDEHGTGD